MNDKRSGQLYVKLRGVIENKFCRLGFIIANKPWHTIFTSLALLFLSCTGLFKFSQEKDPLKLWVDQRSSFVHDTNWLINTFGDGYRSQNVLITAENVLEPNVLQQIAHINNKIRAIISETENSTIRWDDACFKVPIVPIKYNLRKQNAPDVSIPDSDKFINDTKMMDRAKDLDPSTILPPTIYCTIINSFKEGCLQYNFIDVWKYDEDSLNNLSTNDILYKLNSTSQSPTLGHPTAYVDFLGGVQRNASGYITSAKAILSTWVLHINFSSLNIKELGNDAGTENWATYENLILEKKFLDVMEEVAFRSKNMSIYYESGRSYGDISSGAMFEEVDKLMIGIVLMCAYVHIVISEWNWIHQRWILGSMGLLGIGVSFLMAISFCSVFGFSYGPVHTSLPFLLMGLGVDDMFVLLACWQKVSEGNRATTIPERVSLMLKQAGMAITVTTCTDVAAFLVGSFTVIPSLQSFCIYAAVGVFIVYIFTVTFFVACFTLDQRRVENNYNGFIPCYKHNSHAQDQRNHNSVVARLTDYVYSKIIITKFGKIIVLLCTLIMAAISVQNALALEQKFDPFWFIPENTYLFKYMEKRREYFPQIGHEAAVYMGHLNYSADFHNIIKLEHELRKQDVITRIDSWVISFCEYALVNFDIDLKEDTISESKWNTILSKYLFSASGAKHRAKFKFIGNLVCGKPAPYIKASSINFHFKIFNESNLSVTAMKQIQTLAHNVNFTTGDKFCIAWGKMFGSWSTDEIIGREVSRNLCLALGSVMACTLIFIANLNICFWIFLCVLLSLVNVCGWMYLWGLTIDLVSCIALQLSIGLSIDYATHIGHIFLLVEENTATKCTINAMKLIGPAVLYGGGSTLLALSMLAFSDVYTFKVFFKIFFLVIIFGLYHGIIFLPVILSILGPLHKKQNNQNEEILADIIMPIQNEDDRELTNNDEAI